LQTEHPLLLANALTINPLLDWLPTTNDVSITVPLHLKHDHASFFSKLVKQTNHCMLIFV